MKRKELRRKSKMERRVQMISEYLLEFMNEYLLISFIVFLVVATAFFR